MGETIITANGLDICTEVRGPDDGIPLLLVMGLGAQLISWPDEFVDSLVDRGFRVIRHDNRDVGHSTHFDGQVVDVVEIFTKYLSGESFEVPYTLSDMAADSAGVLDALGIASAHIVGASMGGMIVQTMAIEHPNRVDSVVSIMSTTGDPDVGQPTAEASAHMFSSPPASEDEAVISALAASRLWGCAEDYRDDVATEDRVRREWQRGRDPQGVARQIAAIAASGSRSAGIASATMPFTVIHGDHDNLVAKSGGIRTAEAVPGSVYLEVEGMGHDLPAPLWPQIFEAIVSTVRRATVR